MLKEKKVYEVGQIVKIKAASIGAATVVTTITAINGPLIEAGIYLYSAGMIEPATEQDIENARAWSEREAEMRTPKPLNYKNAVPAGWDAFDEDGVAW